MEKNRPLLQVKNLTISFPKDGAEIKVVDAVSFEVLPGEILGVVGESGSGKSLTALSIMDLLPETAIKQKGQLLFTPIQADIWQQSTSAMTKFRGAEIGMIFQEPMTSLNPVLTCGHQLREAIQQHKKLTTAQAKTVSLEWMEKVGLTDLERIYRSYPHQLSGGQKQRVILAMALCGEPKLLIADEPTTALDVTIQKKILELLLKIKEEAQVSILFISHDLAVVAEIADRVLVMQRGRVVEAGVTTEVFAHPRHPYTQGLVACKPKLGQRYYRLPTLSDYLEDQPKRPSVSDNQQEKLKKTASDYLSIENLSVEYANNTSWWKKNKSTIKAVNEVSFQIKTGETLGLVGESGCGKSTLAKTVAQLIEPSAGNILIEGKDYKNLQADKNFYRKVQIIFQDPYSSLNPRIPVGEAITEPMLVHKIGANKKDRREKTIHLLETVGLTADDYKKYPHQFSGGQRQRISIARALSVEPKFLICDEVVSALDVSVQATVLNLLKDLQENQGLTYLFISHDLAVVQFMSDRIAVMNKGEIVELADTFSIYENPQQPYTKKLIDAIPGQK